MFSIVKLRRGTWTLLLSCILIVIIIVGALLYPLALQADNQDSCVRLPVIMYHSILKNTNMLGDYVITPGQLESDLKYISKNGYTTVTVDDLINYVDGKSDLPDKPIMLTFDDGFYNNYYYAYPLMKKYKMKAIISPVMFESEKYTLAGEKSPSYGYCAYEELKEMSDSLCFEIQNHSYNMHSLKGRKGVSKKSGEDDAIYKNLLEEDITKAHNMIEEVTQKEPKCFVYPYGAFSDRSEEVIKELGYRSSMICTEGVNEITKDSECLYKLKRYLRPANITTEELFRKWESDS